MKDDFKSFCIAIVLSAIAVTGINYFFPINQPQQTEPDFEAQIAQEEQDAVIIENGEEQFAVKDEIVLQDVRIPLKNSDISGSIRLKGARFDDILLSKYKQTIAQDSPLVELFAPAKTVSAFYAEYGWLSADNSLKLPNSNTLWQTNSTELTPDSPVVLTWDNGEGLIFDMQISLDKNYLFNITQHVTNNTGKEVTLIPYGLMSKHFDVQKEGRSIVHQGFTGIIDGDLKEYNFSDLHEKKFDKQYKVGEQMPEDKNFQKFEDTDGWVSLTDKYWFGAFIFNPGTLYDINVRNVRKNIYQLDFKGKNLTVAAGETKEISSAMFAGAKEIKLLDKYAEKINKFDLAVDFGWYYFLTKPFFYILDFLYHLIGNMGWAIIVFAAILRLLMFPIANKSFDSMSKMKKIQPKVMALQQIYKDNKMALQQATMELYRKEKVNPASGCLPMFIQIPIFFSLYKVLNIAIEIRHAPFIGWIKDLSAPDPLTISTWAHIYVPSALDIGVWPIIYGLTMYLQQKLNPAPANKDQARMFALMPIIFTLMFAHFASGLVIYWTLSNILSIIQQKAIMHKNGVK